MMPASNARMPKVIAPPRVMVPARSDTGWNGSGGAANGQAKMPIKMAPVATEAAILTLISQDSSIT